MSPHPTSIADQRRAVAGAAIGNFITWFDFGAYGFLAVYLSAVFFPTADPAMGLLATFAVFGVAFLMNPLGGLVFGPLGDRIGRRSVLAIVIVTMSIASFLVGLLPGYGAIGFAAPALLVFLRLVQGLAGGGEPGGAATFLAEFARSDRRAFTVSFWHASSYLANAAASLLVLSLAATLSYESMIEWGWRIPFLISAPLGLVGLWIRLKLSDTPAFEALRESGEVSESPTRDTFRLAWRQILQVVGAIALQAAAFYFIFVYMETYIQSELGRSPAEASVSTVVTLTVASVAIFFFARISDQVGRRPMMLGGSVGCAVVAFPAFLLFGAGNMPMIILGHAVLGVFLAMFMSASGAALVEIFPTKVRTGGFSIGFNISCALFGGTAPTVATFLIASSGSPLTPALIMIATGVVAAATVLTMRETAGPRRQGSDLIGVETASGTTARSLDATAR